MNRFQTISGYIVVVTIWLTAIWLAYKYYEVPNYEDIPIKLEQPEFFLADNPTKELVIEACEYFELKHVDIVVAQSILETGNYHSRNCVENNNLFGLYNSRRKQYFKFDKWWKSVRAYKDMIQYRYDGGDYYDFLLRIKYATDSSYISKVKNIKEKL